MIIRNRAELWEPLARKEFVGCETARNKILVSMTMKDLHLAKN